MGVCFFENGSFFTKMEVYFLENWSLFYENGSLFFSKMEVCFTKMGVYIFENESFSLKVENRTCFLEKFTIRKCYL